MRRKIIAGNWKMNKLPNEALDFITELEPLVKNSENEIVLCVPYIDLFYTLLNAQGTNIKIDTHSSSNRTPFHNHRCPEQLKKGRGSQEDKNAKSPMYKSTWTYQCIHHQKE